MQMMDKQGEMPALRAAGMTLDMVCLWGAILIGLIGLAGCGSSQAPDPRTQPPLVAIAQAQPASMHALSFTGVVAARYQSGLGFRVDGKITKRWVDVGDHVKKGQTLMTLDPVDLRHQAANSQADVASAKADYVRRRADLKRLDGLVEAGAISAQQYDSALAAERQAKGTLDAAQQRANVAENQLDYGVLKADAAGVIVSRSGEPGQVVRAGQQVLTLAQDGPREAVVYLPETVRPKPGSNATATLFGTRRQFAVRLRALSDASDDMTRTYAARYVMVDGADQPPLGSSVMVQLAQGATGDSAPATPGQDPAAAWVVPIGAVIDPGNGPGVWRVNPSDKTVAWQPVQLQSTADETMTVQGLSAGDWVVSMGAHALHAGQTVRVATGVFEPTP